MDYETRTSELVEQWLNGNHQAVCRSIVLDYSTKRAAVLAANVCHGLLYAREGQHEQDAFLRILETAE